MMDGIATASVEDVKNNKIGKIKYFSIEFRK